MRICAVIKSIVRKKILLLCRYCIVIVLMVTFFFPFFLQFVSLTFRVVCLLPPPTLLSNPSPLPPTHSLVSSLVPCHSFSLSRSPSYSPPIMCTFAPRTVFDHSFLPPSPSLTISSYAHFCSLSCLALFIHLCSLLL